MTIGAGSILLHYRVVDKIGEGGMGQVWRAVDTTLDRDVAIKVLPSGVASDGGRLARFEREAKLLATLNHPHIASIFGLHRQDDVLFIAMELVEGEDLATRLGRGPIELKQAVSIGRQIAEALGTAHERGVVHRDLKPANIVVTPGGVVKVLDFGLAKQLRSDEKSYLETTSMAGTATMGRDLTEEGTTIGTLAYMAPEQLRAEAVDARADIFSFGVMLYEMVAGRHPFRREQSFETISGILRDDPPALGPASGRISKSLEKLVYKALAKDVTQRFQTVREVADLLQALQKELEATDAPGISARGLWRAMRRPRIAVPAVLVVAAAVFAASWWSDRRAKRRWATEVGLPEVERLVEASWRDFDEAYAAALEVEQVIPGHPQLEKLFERCSTRLTVTTEPEGAVVSVKSYRSPEDEWTELGATPLTGVRLPITIFRWKIEKPGYETTYAVDSTWAILPDLKNLLGPNDFSRKLDERKPEFAGMVRVRGGKSGDVEFPDFYIDRFEVTNREFRRFVDAGGYANEAHWKHPFIDNGRELDRDEAMSRFVDRTGRPGPATWSGGLYPPGEDDHPVSGVSWYEAAAYAEFAGKSLPTSAHWGLARGEATMVLLFPQLGGYATFAPFSNFGGKGAVAAGSLPGITAYGAYDMAGNVREWCFNESVNGRVVRGGSWTDATYMFQAQSQAPAMDRSPQNGFRCARYPDPTRIPDRAFAKIRPQEPRDIRSARPVGDAVFDVIRRQFDYDPDPLEPEVESKVESPGGWTHERITYNAAYGDDRVIAHLFLPANAKPPYQTVVYFPGGGSQQKESSQDIETYFEFPVFLSFLVGNGRAVLYPVYKGTFERRDATLGGTPLGSGSRRYTEYLIRIVKDFRRSIDYLETRDDIDAGKIAYYGMSWGAVLGGTIPAVESRIKASVLVAGGVDVTFPDGTPALFPPETDPSNYLPRVTVPTLMINGRYDSLLTLEHAAQPMLDLLGTPAEHKKMLLFDTDHIPPRDGFIKGTLDWFDRYLGPVELAD